MSAIRREELDIINPTMEAIGQFLPNLLCEIGKKPNLKVVFCDPDGAVEDELIRVYNNTDFPYAALMQRSSTINASNLNFRAMRQYPIPVKQESGMLGLFRLTPVTVTFEARYCASDYRMFSKALQRWLSRTDDLIFAIIVKGLKINIKCRLGTDVQLPTAEEGDNGSIRKADFQIEADTYVGEIEYREPIREITLKINDSVGGNLITFKRVRQPNE